MDAPVSVTQSTAARGLSADEARERLVRDGPNLLPSRRRRNLLGQLVRQMTHLLALLLWVAVFLALLAGMPTLSVAIAVIVVLNALFAFWQEYRADRSTQRLQGLLPTTTLVRRDGHPTAVDAAELVMGDRVLLAAGDRVAADLLVEIAHDLSLDESLVTGESGGVEHGPADRLLAGTFVLQGEAEATVAAVGAHTTLAGISALAESADRPPSPLSVQLSHVVRVVAVFAAATGTLLATGSLALGLDPREAFLFGVGISVALVPEGLLPTVTLSLARGAQLMAGRNALLRRLDAVETLGATTFICTDKTGTLTQNRMAVVDVLTTAGPVTVTPAGYAPTGELAGSPDAVAAVARVLAAGLACVRGRVVERPGGWVAEGDPMEAAIHCLALRCGVTDGPDPRERRRPYTAERMLSSVQRGGEVWVLGAPEAVFGRCPDLPEGVHDELSRLTRSGRRVVAVAGRSAPAGCSPDTDLEHGLDLLGLIGLEDPPRDDVQDSLEACRVADIRVAMVTGDHPWTAAAIAREVGLLKPGGTVTTGAELPEDDAALAALLDRPEGAVVARVTPADKFRIARVLREHGHVVAMTGDGVNDAPALREADVGVAMGASGSDVAREAADLVLLDDHFGTIVAAIELGRATLRNVRRFLTYHLSDNVAELAPFALWALTAGQFPLAIGVLQVLALDIGTDMLPALALGAEPSNPRIMRGRQQREIIDRGLLVRAFGILGATEALGSMTAFAFVLLAGGWTWGAEPSAALLAVASGTAFAAISVGQMANAFACRSGVHPVWRLKLLGNRLVLYAVAAEFLLLMVFLGTPALREVLGGSWPTPAGWGAAAATALAVLLADAAAKTVWRHRQPGRGTAK